MRLLFSSSGPVSRAAVLIRAGVVRGVCVCVYLNECEYVCMFRVLGLVDVGARAVTGHGAARCGLRTL